MRLLTTIIVFLLLATSVSAVTNQFYVLYGEEHGETRPRPMDNDISAEFMVCVDEPTGKQTLHYVYTEQYDEKRDCYWEGFGSKSSCTAGICTIDMPEGETSLLIYIHSLEMSFRTVVVESHAEHFYVELYPDNGRVFFSGAYEWEMETKYKDKSLIGGPVYSPPEQKKGGRNYVGIFFVIAFIAFFVWRVYILIARIVELRKGENNKSAKRKKGK